MQNIQYLQDVVKKFIIDHDLFPTWHIVTSEENLTEEQMLQEMQKNGKERVLLLTGLKGGTGCTYKKCALTIHFDNSKSLLQFKQHSFRAATPKERHRYFFTFDMNIQRSFDYQYSLTQDLFDSFRGGKTMEECYLYVREYDLIRFNPREHCRTFKELSPEEILDSFKKDWCSIESSRVIHRFSTEFKLPTFMSWNGIDIDIINTLFPLILPFISNSILNFKKIQEEDREDDSEEHKAIPLPKEKNRKFGEKEKTLNKKIVLSDVQKKEIVYKFCEFFFNHISFWMFVWQISLDELFERKDFINEILDIFIDFQKLNNLSFNKEHLFDTMKEISRLNPKIIDGIKRVYQRNSSTKHIREQLEKLLVPTEKEKNERGFVITPSFLAEEMISQIPLSF